MEMDSLRDLFVEQLQDLYSAENQILKALPKMIKNAKSEQLKAGFQEHLQQTQQQVERLDQIFESLDEDAEGKTCKGMQGLLKEGEELMGEDADDDVMDAGLISAAQHVEHYEIAGYGTVRTYAELLGEKEAARLLQTTLDEEKLTDEKLTKLASKINVKAEKAA
jgi:ferritin-like metal-binding protein YciE